MDEKDEDGYIFWDNITKKVLKLKYVTNARF